MPSEEQDRPAIPHGTPMSLAKFARAYALHLWEPLLQKQCISVQQLATLSLPDLIAAFPIIPAGVLVHIQSATQTWLRPASDEARPLFRCLC